MTKPKPDHFTEDGARALAKRIREYWAARGGVVATTVVHVNMGPAGYGTGSMFGVRSDMVDAFPRRASA